jgi:hypothetical protein
VSSRAIVLASLAVVVALGALGSFLLNAFDASGAVSGLVFVALVAIAGVLGALTDDWLPPPRGHHR